MRVAAHVHTRAARAALLALAACAAIAAAPLSPAHAAYAPVLSVTIDPATAGAAPAITTTTTQAAGETANKTVKVDFPLGYAGNLGATLAMCSADQEKANTCPDSSRMGSAAATASVLGLPQALSGNVYFGGLFGNQGFKLIVYLSNPVLGTQTLEGFSTFLPTGVVETTFDNLPNVLTTSFQLKLEGGARSLLVNPPTCGSFTFSAKFTSQNGEQAQSSANVAVNGCPPPLSPAAITALSLRPATVRAGHKAILRFMLDRPAAVRVSIQPIGSHARARRQTIDGVAGLNTVGNIAHKLTRGRYRVTATTVGDFAGTTSASATLTVRR
jgi:hypothetical protein